MPAEPVAQSGLIYLALKLGRFHDIDRDIPVDRRGAIVAEGRKVVPIDDGRSCGVSPDAENAFSIRQVGQGHGAIPTQCV